MDGRSNEERQNTPTKYFSVDEGFPVKQKRVFGVDWCEVGARSNEISGDLSDDKLVISIRSLVNIP
jgi:hypothetical protein